MKNFYLLFITLMVYTGFSQSLPIQFEGDITTTDFENFDGGTAIVTSNPKPSGSNTSSTVAQIIKDGGAIWGGSKITLTNNLDFSVDTKITMQIYTTAPSGTTVKFKLEGSGGSVDVDATTTISGAWETLEWVFVGTPNTLNQLVFMFDYGNQGDGSDRSTFYFDDIKQIAGPTAPIPTSLPIDFETGIVSTDFVSASGAKASVIANPQKNGSNTSNTVCQIVRDGGTYSAGSKIFIDRPIDLSTMWHISMKVFTTAPIGTRIKLELENVSGATNLDYLTTVTGAWETASWNFDGQANAYDRIQFYFDFGIVGDGTETATFLFDDVQQFAGPALAEPVAASLPIDFENSVVTTDFTNFFGSIATVIPNPQIDANNPSATVGQFIRSGGQGYARSKLALTDFIENMSASGTISMKVYTDAPVGTLMKFKLESNVADFGKEKDVFTTVSGEWATYNWDLSNGDNGIYNVLTLMLGYATPNDASANATFLFDDIAQDLTLSAGMDKTWNIAEIKSYPNPAKDLLTISAKNENIKTITLFDILGNKVITIHPNSREVTIDVSNFGSGVYVAKISTLEGMGSIKLILE
jgi:hypothetical protein